MSSIEMKVSNPEDVQVTLTITWKLSAFKQLSKSLYKTDDFMLWPVNELRTAIRDLTNQVEATNLADLNPK